MADALARLPIPRRLLSALLLLLGGLMAPHAANLSPAILGFFYTAAAWRLLALLRPHWMPGRWTLLFLMVAALALVVFTTGLYDGRLAGTALLVVMLGLKLLELRARRDIHVTVFLGYFLVFTQFLYNQSLWLAVYLFLGVLALTVIQVSLNRVHVGLRTQLRNSAAMLAGALPLALVVFLLFPRLQAPLWAINTPSSVTGISGEMTLGNIGRLSQSNDTAFRVQFFSSPPPPAQRYWRGPVLWQTDGRRWSAGLRPIRSGTDGGNLPQPVDYEVTLEPTGEYWLFGLDVVTRVPPGAQLNRNFALVADQRVTKRVTYRAASDPDFLIRELSAHEHRLGLQLPDRISPRVTALVASWQAQTDPRQPLQLVDKALAYFRVQPFVYTLQPGTLEAEDPIEQFLFETRRGFCEHYAASFALMMRIAGIPARVVVGYQGGEKNPHAEHWVIRQSDAHAWVEVWSGPRGWQRVDPTAAVAPERIEQAINTALSRDSERVMFRADGEGLLGGMWRNAVWLADAVDLGWHRWVVGFSAEHQSSLLEMFGIRNLKGYGLAVALIVGGTMTVALVYLLAQLPRPQIRDPLPLLWQRFVSKLARAGLDSAPWQGPDTVCANARARFPAAADQLAAINRLYVQLRYGPRQDVQQFGALRRRIQQLKLKAE